MRSPIRVSSRLVAIYNQDAPEGGVSPDPAEGRRHMVRSLVGRPIEALPRVLPDLVDRLVARDATAYEELVRLHGPRMLAVAGRYLHRKADAEDAVQESFTNVVRSISRFGRASSLETWIHRIVVNCALTSLRRRRRKPETALEDSILDGETTPLSRRWPPPSAHEAVADEETRRIVRREVDRLPELQRCVLLLRDIEAVDVKTIAEILHVGVSTVKIRLHRARQALQTSLAPRMFPPDERTLPRHGSGAPLCREASSRRSDAPRPRPIDLDDPHGFARAPSLHPAT
jgi:RNA polymerase sigma-70 factor, ECF subfamily